MVIFHSYVNIYQRVTLGFKFAARRDFKKMFAIWRSFSKQANIDIRKGRNLEIPPGFLMHHWDHDPKKTWKTGAMKTETTEVERLVGCPHQERRPGEGSRFARLEMHREEMQLENHHFKAQSIQHHWSIFYSYVFHYHIMIISWSYWSY